MLDTSSGPKGRKRARLDAGLIFHVLQGKWVKEKYGCVVEDSENQRRKNTEHQKTTWDRKKKHRTVDSQTLQDSAD